MYGYRKVNRQVSLGLCYFLNIFQPDSITEALLTEMLKWTHIAVLVFWVACVAANVEKVIFLAPTHIAIPTPHPNLNDLRLDSISPVRSSLRTQLAAQFPQDKAPRGRVSWFLLDGLEPGRRYETRICWAATVRFQILCVKLLSST